MAALIGALIGGGVTYAVTRIQLDRAAEVRLQDQRQAAYGPFAEEVEALHSQLDLVVRTIEANPEYDATPALEEVEQRLQQLRSSVSMVRIVGSDGAQFAVLRIYSGLWDATNQADESVEASNQALDDVMTNYLTFADLARKEVGAREPN